MILRQYVGNLNKKMETKLKDQEEIIELCNVMLELG